MKNAVSFADLVEQRRSKKILQFLGVLPSPTGDRKSTGFEIACGPFVTYTFGRTRKHSLHIDPQV